MKDLALDEITMRRYEIPGKIGKNEKENERQFMKKFCLSLGLLQEGDGRDIIVDMLLVFLRKKKERKMINIKELHREIITIRKNFGLDERGISHSNIRRQLKRLKDMMLIEKIKDSYRISEFDLLTNIVEKKIFQIKLKGIMGRIKEYAEAIDEISA